MTKPNILVKNKNKFKDERSQVSSQSSKSKPGTSFVNSGPFKKLNTSNNEEPLISNSSRQRIDSEYDSTHKPNNMNCINLNVGGDVQHKDDPLRSKTQLKDEEIIIPRKIKRNEEIFRTGLQVEEQEENKELELKQEMVDIREKSIHKRDPFELKERSKSKLEGFYSQYFQIIINYFRV